jgi:hypothetical protein
MPSPEPLSDNDELAWRVARIQQCCEDLQVARDAAAQQRDLISQKKQDAEAMYHALSSGKPNAR